MWNITLACKRPFIWLRRFRKRCGYGVHSPFAFDLITNVIYEKRPYYAYADLRKRCKELQCAGEKRPDGLGKVNKLLFRLVNRCQPQTILDLGTPSLSACYLIAGKLSARYYQGVTFSESAFPETGAIDFLYIHHYPDSGETERSFLSCVNLATEQSLFVVEGIRYSADMKALWERIQNHPKVGITFDLYDVGLIFFDLKKIKEHYLVNF